MDLRSRLEQNIEARVPIYNRLETARLGETTRPYVFLRDATKWTCTFRSRGFIAPWPLRLFSSNNHEAQSRKGDDESGNLLMSQMGGLKGASARALLLMVIAAGIVLRLIGLEWGIPLALPPEATPYRNSFHFDEDNYLWGLTHIDPKRWNFDVQDLHWGTLQFYLIGAALQVAESSGYLTRRGNRPFSTGIRSTFPGSTAPAAWFLRSQAPSLCWSFS